MTDAMGQAELAALRARAYGRDADIHDDPVALQRLAELEDAARGAAAGASAAGAGVGGDEPHTAELAEPQHPIIAPASEASPEPEIGMSVSEPGEEENLESPVSAPRSRWSWMLRPPVWIASLALTAVLTAVVTTLIVTYDPTVVARLHEIPRDERPAAFKAFAEFGFDEPPRVFEEYRGLTPVVGAGAPLGQPTVLCLYVMSEGDIVSGMCQGEGIEPRADFIVGGDNGVDVRDAFADGTTVRVTLEGDTVVLRAVSVPQEAAEP